MGWPPPGRGTGGPIAGRSRDSVAPEAPSGANRTRTGGQRSARRGERHLFDREKVTVPRHKTQPAPPGAALPATARKVRKRDANRFGESGADPPSRRSVHVHRAGPARTAGTLPAGVRPDVACPLRTCRSPGSESPGRPGRRRCRSATLSAGVFSRAGRRPSLHHVTGPDTRRSRGADGPSARGHASSRLTSTRPAT